MIQVCIDLSTCDGLWQIQDISVRFGNGRTSEVGGMTGWQSYPASVHEAKRWAMLKIRHEGRSEGEEQVQWSIHPVGPRLLL